MHTKKRRWSLDQIDAVIDTNPKPANGSAARESQFKALISAPIQSPILIPETAEPKAKDANVEKAVDLMRSCADLSA